MAGTNSKPNKRVTISDVAQEAGVSIAAVSRILNNSYDGFSAREETKQRVHDAVKKLGYRPSRAAVRLATGRHNAIGLCYPAMESLDGPIDTNSLPQVFRHFNLMLVQHGIFRALQNTNTDLVIMPRHAGRSTADIIAQAQESVDGLVWINPESDPDSVATLVESGVRVAIVGAAPLSGDFVNVRTEETVAGRMAMGHLIVCGARRITVIISEAKKLEHATVERLEGIKKAVNDFTAPNLSFNVLYVPAEQKKIRPALQKAFDKNPPPDGILTIGEYIPLAVLGELADRDINIPKQCKVVGFEENLTFYLATPSLTGLRYPIEEMCFRATELLMEYIRTGVAPKPHYTTPQLIARASCS